MSNLPNSVLNRIRQNRNRAAVPPRNDALITKPNDPPETPEIVTASPPPTATTPALAEVSPAIDLPDIPSLTGLPAIPAPATSAKSIPSKLPEPTIDDDDDAASASENSSTLAELRAELAKIPETHRHSAIVLEKLLDHHLSRYCKDNRITIEVFLEAAWTYAIANPDAMSEIVQEAKRRYAARKHAGKLRRLITMLGG